MAKKVFDALGNHEFIEFSVYDRMNNELVKYKVPVSDQIPLISSYQYSLLSFAPIGVKENSQELNEYSENPIVKNKIRGDKRYYLQNHVATILGVITDQKLKSSLDSNIYFFLPETESYFDYYPFGSLQQFGNDVNDRCWTASLTSSEMGFHSAKHCDEYSSSMYEFDFRIYDAELARWNSIDPLFAIQPNQSTYKYCLNNPNIYRDKLGLTEGNFIVEIDEEGNQTTTKTSDFGDEAGFDTFFFFNGPATDENGEISDENYIGFTQVVHNTTDSEPSKFYYYQLEADAANKGYYQGSSDQGLPNSSEEWLIIAEQFKSLGQFVETTVNTTVTVGSLILSFGGSGLAVGSVRAVADDVASAGISKIGQYGDEAISIAANSIDEVTTSFGKLTIRPDIVVAGGRSGQYIKLFQGPSSAILKGAKQGRILITDKSGRIIWDITKERAKQGGVKYPTTDEQLELIKLIWG